MDISDYKGGLCLVRKIVQLDKADREVLFSRTSEKKGLNPSIVEKMSGFKK